MATGHRDVAPSEGQLVRSFADFGPAFKAWLRHRLGKDALSHNHARTLDALAHGPLISAELAGELGVTARYVTGLVDALAEDGLVRRSPHRRDKRATVVELTPSGRRRQARLEAASAAAITELLEPFDDDTRQLIGRVLGSMLDRMSPPADGASGRR